MAVIKFDSAIDPEYIGMEFGDTSYHTVVTVFEPNVVRDGMDFDYAEELLSNPDNIELKIERRQPTGSATQEKHPNTSSELPSNIRISQTEKKSTPSAEKVSSKIRESRKSAVENRVDNVDTYIKTSYNNSSKIRSSEKVNKYIPHDNIDKETIQFLRRELYKFYSGVESGIADGVALEHGKTIYIVDSGKDNNGSISFGVRKKITVSNDEKRRRYIQEINKESAGNGYGSREIFEKLGVKLDNDSRGNVGRESRQNSSISARNPQHKQGRVSGENANNRGLNKFDVSVTSLLDRVKNSGYGVTQEDVDFVLSAVKDGKLVDTELTEKQRTLVSEVVAMQMEEIFADERSVERLVSDNPSLARSIWERIKALVEAFGKTKEEKAELKKLRETEQLFRKALENAGVKYIKESTENETKISEDIKRSL